MICNLFFTCFLKTCCTILLLFLSIDYSFSVFVYGKLYLRRLLLLCTPKKVCLQKRESVHFWAAKNCSIYVFVLCEFISSKCHRRQCVYEKTVSFFFTINLPRIEKKNHAKCIIAENCGCKTAVLTI